MTGKQTHLDQATYHGKNLFLFLICFYCTCGHQKGKNPPPLQKPFSSIHNIGQDFMTPQNSYVVSKNGAF